MQVSASIKRKFILQNGDVSKGPSNGFGACVENPETESRNRHLTSAVSCHSLGSLCKVNFGRALNRASMCLLCLSDMRNWCKLCPGTMTTTGNVAAIVSQAKT